MHKRYAQCRGIDSVLRTLALLLAALSRATPKQTKEPKARNMNQILVNTIIKKEGELNQTSHLTFCGYQDTLETQLTYELFFIAT
jgi:hypothetical protein